MKSSPQKPSSAPDTTEIQTAQSDSNVQVSELESDANNPLEYQTQEEARLKAYANLLDSAIRLPGGFRIGLDGIVGLVPGIGDLLGAALSGYFIYAASKLDIPKSVISKMLLNTAIETIVGLVPLLGDLFDFFFKANNRNAKLLHEALDARKQDEKRQKTAMLQL